MKFSQLIEHNTVEILFPDPFLKIKIKHISGSIVSCSLFLLYAKLRTIKIY